VNVTHRLTYVKKLTTCQNNDIDQAVTSSNMNTKAFLKDAHKTLFEGTRGDTKVRAR